MEEVLEENLRPYFSFFSLRLLLDYTILDIQCERNCQKHGRMGFFCHFAIVYSLRIPEVKFHLLKGVQNFS